MTLTSVGETDDAKGKTISEIGSMLFTRGVSGTRVVTGRDTKVIEGYTFKGKFACLYVCIQLSSNETAHLLNKYY